MCPIHNANVFRYIHGRYSGSEGEPKVTIMHVPSSLP